MRPLASNAKCLCFAGWHYVLIGILDDADWLKIVARDIWLGFVFRLSPAG